MEWDVRSKAIKYTEGNIGVNLHELVLDSGFLEYQKCNWQKKKKHLWQNIDNWDYN